MEYNLFEQLNNAYGTSTPSNNKFGKLVSEIKWDKVFEVDGETYYCLGGFTLTAENLDPFKQAFKPSVLFSDGSLIELGA